MLPVLVTLLLVGGETSDVVDEAFDTLGNPSATYGELRAACQAIDEGYPDDDPSCVAHLLTIWDEAPGGHRGGPIEALRLACSKAGDATAPIILGKVGEVLKRGDASSRQQAREFFGAAMPKLSRRLTDPEPLLKLAVESGFWNTITRLECSRELLDQYLVEGLRGCREFLSGPYLVSLICYISDAAIPEVRQVMRELWNTSPQLRGFDIALLTLVQAEDREIIPDLETMAPDPRLTEEQRDNAEAYLGKLRHQHSIPDMLKIVETERENKRLLSWAVLRLLWLKTDKKTIYQALATNRRISGHGHDIAREVEIYVFGEDGTGTPFSWHGDPLMLDREERQTSCAEWLRRPLDPQALARYSIAAVVRAAPSGE